MRNTQKDHALYRSIQNHYLSVYNYPSDVSLCIFLFNLQVVTFEIF